LVVLVVLRGPISDEELHAFCRRTLAAYKVPAAFTVLRALPRNAMGKVDRAALAGLV
jgi:O-succinylbenzoic acid--CoA ligase